MYVERQFALSSHANKALTFNERATELNIKGLSGTPLCLERGKVQQPSEPYLTFRWPPRDSRDLVYHCVPESLIHCY